MPYGLVDFDPGFLDSLREFEGKRTVMELTDTEGNSIMVFGDLFLHDHMIRLVNESSKYEPVEGWLSDFKLQIIQPSPFVTLCNLSGQSPGEEHWSEQIHIQSFRVYGQ